MKKNKSEEIISELIRMNDKSGTMIYHPMTKESISQIKELFKKHSCNTEK